MAEWGSKVGGHRAFLSVAAKQLIFLSPLRKYFFYRYQYNFAPDQLCFLCSCIDNIKKIPGVIVEIGCGFGNTTVFLNKHMDFNRIEKEYVCIDTFSGFTQKDIEFEVEHRNKQKKMYRGFSANKKEWFDKTMRENNIYRVKSIQADIKNFSYGSLGAVSFCLIDVDLYDPVKYALDGIYSVMNDGGVIVVDDCTENNIFDGALEAYREFISSHSLKENITLNKLGIINIRST